MTIEVVVDHAIGRTAGAVFDEIAAVERYPEWLTASGVTAVERPEPGPLAAGSRLRIRQRVAGRTAELDGSVTAFEPGRRLAIRVRDGEGIAVEIEATVDGDGAASRLRWTVRIGLPLRYRMFESMVAPEVRRAVRSDVEALRRRLESVAG